jgi:hypothetical protein
MARRSLNRQFDLFVPFIANLRLLLQALVHRLKAEAWPLL